MRKKVKATQKAVKGVVKTVKPADQIPGGSAFFFTNNLLSHNVRN